MPAPAAKPSGIITRVYKSGSIIYFESDKSEHVYILKSGRVLLTYVKVDTGEEIKEDVRVGEFFGVKSALGKYPREETAQTIGETIVLVLPLAEFEKLVLRNVNVVRKMLSVFSNQLRRVHKSVRTVMGETENVNPADELFKIGDYYYKSGSFKHARYAFKKYLEFYPGTQYSTVASQRIKAIDTGKAEPESMPMASARPAAAAPRSPMAEESSDFTFDETDDSRSLHDDAGPSDDFTDFHDDGHDMGHDDHASGTGLSGEMDDFIADDSHDNFSFDEPLPEPAAPAGPKGIAVRFEGAMGMFGAGEFAEALDVYLALAREQGNVSSDKKYIENANFEAGKCYYRLGKQREALETFSAAMKAYPDSHNLKSAYFYLGMIFENAKQKDKALTYFKKVATMAPADQLSDQAQKKVNQLQAR